MAAYEDMIRGTATEEAPWYVVPADNKWFTRIAVACAIIDTMWSLDLKYPEVSDAMKKDLAAARRMLMKDSGGRGRDPLRPRPGRTAARVLRDGQRGPPQPTEARRLKAAASFALGAASFGGVSGRRRENPLAHPGEGKDIAALRRP